MKEFTVPMALVDYLPVILFFLSARIIDQYLKKQASSLARYMFAFGAAAVTCAGFLKASYKLLYALQIGRTAAMPFFL